MSFLWPYLLMLLSGASDAALRGVIKLTNVHKFVLLAGGFFVALPFYFVWLSLEGLPTVGGGFWPAVALHVPLFIVANILMVEAHRSSPLILTVPYLTLTPAFLLVVSPIINGGAPTWVGALGVLVITIGVYLLNLGEARKGALGNGGSVSLWEPFRALSRERGSRLMLAVSAIFAVTGSLDKVALNNANGPFYLTVDHGLTALGMTALALIYAQVSEHGGNIRVPRGKSWLFLSIFGCATAVSVILHMVGLRLITTVPYAIAMKRSGAVVCTVLMGFVLSGKNPRKGFEREREQLGVRLAGIALMLTGMVVILLWGKEQ